MKRIAMKTISYLPETFQYSRQFQTVTGTPEENTYDDFWMTCTLFEFDGVLTCWIGLDCGQISKLTFEIIKEEINKATAAIGPGHLYVNGTHTHSGPSFTKVHSHDTELGIPEPMENVADICFHIAKLAAGLVQDCMGRLEPFESEIKVTSIEGCYSNRNGLDAPCDKNVTLIRFKNAETGAPIGMWLNMSCHSTMIYPRTMKMSTDLVGNVTKRMAAHYGAPVMPTCGCQGDTSTRLTRNRTDSEEGDLSELERIVTGVVDQVLREPEDFEPINIDRFETTKYQLNFHYERPTEVTDKKIENLKKEIAEGTNKDVVRVKKAVLDAMSAQIGMTEFQNTLQGIAINMGELKIGLFPGELVASLGLQIVRHKSHDHRLVICYTNEGVGYLVEESEYGNSLESISSIIPVGMPEVLTTMMVKELDQFELLK